MAPSKNTGKSKDIAADMANGAANIAANNAALENKPAAENQPEAEAKRGRGRPKSENLTVASFKAIVKAHQFENGELPANVRFVPGQQVEGSTRWTPNTYTTGAHWRVDGSKAQVVTLTSNGKDVTETLGKSVDVADYL